MFQTLGRVIKVQNERDGPCFRELPREGVTKDGRMRWKGYLLNAFPAT